MSDTALETVGQISPTQMLAVDPSFLLGRRGQEWLERVHIGGHESRLVFPSEIVRLSEAGSSELRQFQSDFVWGAAPRIPNVLVRNFPQVQASNYSHLDSGADRVVQEIVAALASGAVLIARRRETLDLIAAAEYPLVVRGPSFYERLFVQVCDSGLEANLLAALRRRARYFAVEGPPLDSSEDVRSVLVGDSGRGAIR